MACHRIDQPATLDRPAAVIWICGPGRRKGASVPGLNRKTLQRDPCKRCAWPHDQMAACPPRGVWLAAWSMRVNGVRR